ncbi:MAG: neutral/alkaline non-lysosomal ceramidase N-terminal domain-containing protein [Candidatus Binatia bacterium]|nr:neutral/alkaline non-lysosomal ceramidase N-terminal domain-containing protein [Candidatus Binatia bacterium]
MAKRNITPDTPVFLGGYGLGPARRSTGVLSPIYVRALVISDGVRTVAFAANETQGTFAAYKRGPFGLADVRAAVAQATSGAIPPTHIVVNSDHSHAGPDTTGVWGGLPNSYMQFLFDQTVGAIVDAWNALRPAELRVGAVDATELLRSQFGEPPNDRVDGELRVLAAYDAENPKRPRAVLINFAAHATVMGASNTLLSADWPGVVADMTEAEFGLDGAVVMVADVGRTQPADRGDLEDVERLQEYSNRVQAKVRAAMQSLVAVRGTTVDAQQFFLREPYGNPLVEYTLLATLVSRSLNPPWVEGTSIGTVVSVARVGELLFTAVPGEGYPAIHFELQQRVPAQKHFIFGLANDQLGYLIAPEEGYEQVRAAAPENDNAIFNVSPAIGDHVLCVALDGVATIGFTVQEPLAKCARWAGEDRSLPVLWE